MRGKDGINNIFYSVLGQIIAIIMGIIIPRLFIMILGSETNGLMSTINQVFAYFTLIEAGIGITTVQALYKPVANDDKKTINSILAATNKYYKRVAFVYSIALVAFAVIFAVVIRSTLNPFVIVGVIIFTGLNSVIGFAVQSKYSLLLDVLGKKYITTNTQTIVTLLTNISKIVLLLMGFNLLIVQMSFFILNLLQVVIISVYVKKHYKWLDLSEKPNFQAISQKNSVLIHQLSGLIFSNTDILILTIVCGLEVSSVYAMYKVVMSMVSTLFSNLAGSMTFILGHTFSTDMDLYKRRIDVYDAAYQTFGFSICTIVYIFFLPFIKIYTAGADINYIFPMLPILFIIIELLNVMRNASLNTISIAGHFQKTQWRSVAELVINLTTSLIFVFKFGIYGVLIGTIIALFYRSNDIIIYANKRILKRSPWNTYKISLINIGLTALFVWGSAFVPIKADGFVSLIISASVVSIIVMPCFFLVVSVFCGKERRAVIRFIKMKLSDRKSIR